MAAGSLPSLGHRRSQAQRSRQEGLAQRNDAARVLVSLLWDEGRPPMVTERPVPRRPYLSTDALDAPWQPELLSLADRARLTNQRDPTLLRSGPRTWLSEKANLRGNRMGRVFTSSRHKTAARRSGRRGGPATPAITQESSHSGGPEGSVLAGRRRDPCPQQSGGQMARKPGQHALGPG